MLSFSSLNFFQRLYRSSDHMETRARLNTPAQSQRAYSGTLTRREIVRADTSLGELRKN